jgi:hypothetical protein
VVSLFFAKALPFGKKGLEHAAFRAAAAAVLALGTVATLAGAVRVLPFISDPELPWSAAAPFARSVLWLALEVAIAVGWPLGWGLAFATAVDRGEVRVYALLGRAPIDFARILGSQALLFGALLAGCSWLAARDAQAPGRVLGATLESSRTVCGEATGPRTIPIPFLDARWLCAPERAPRLVFTPPRPQGALLTASQVHFSSDVRDVTFDDVHLAVGPVDLVVAELQLRRLPALVASATFSPARRAATVAAAALASAFGLIWLIVRMRIRRPLIALAFSGLSGGAGLGLLHALDRAGARAGFLVLVPMAVVCALALGAATLGCLRRNRGTATPLV